MPNPPSTGLPNAQDYDTTVTGVVRDLVTDLMWERDVEPGPHTYSAAVEQCDMLSLAGFDDWRLPTIIELVSIVDFSTKNPSIDAVAFTGTPTNEAFWASTLVVWNASGAQSVNFGSGDTSDSYMGTGNRVRCVRATRAAHVSAPYVVEADTVYDSRTTLTWQRAATVNQYSWSSALDYCAALDLANGGWRLPSMKELETLIDFSRSSPAIDAATFPSSSTDHLWTSSLAPGNPSLAWLVDFSSGGTLSQDIGAKVLVRCVR